EGEQHPLSLACVLSTEPFLELAVLTVEISTALRVEQAGDHTDDPRGIHYVHGRCRVLRRDSHSSVLLGRGGAADQQRKLEAAAFHLAGHAHHLVQGRRYQSRETDHLGAFGCGHVEDAVGRHHHTQVDYFVRVASEHDAHDVLADVMDVAFHGGQHHLGPNPAIAGLFLGRHERFQVGDGPLHGSGALDDLGQEHLAGPEQIPNHLHAGHQRPFDHGEGTAQLLASLLGVFLYEVDDTMDERMREPLLDPAFTP